jgi:undecaprenyl-diphosphatase
MTDPSPVPPARRSRLDNRPLLHNHPIAFRIAAVLLTVGALLFIALAIPTTAAWVQRADDAVYRFVVDVEWVPLVAISKVLDFLGSTVVTLPLMIVVAGYLAWRTRWEAFFTWVAAMVLSQLLIGPVKNLYERPRPPLPLVETTGFSFPSGHAVATGAIAVGLAIVLIPAGLRRRTTELMAILVVIVMAMSRVYLRAHWLSDALAGAVMGAGIAVAVAAVVHWVDERREAGG